MKKHQVNIIKEYVSTALISDDPEEVLVKAFTEIIEINEIGCNTIDLIEYLFQAEKNLPLNNLGK